MQPIPHWPLLSALARDVIITGTPSGFVGPIVAGDSVNIWVEGVGMLTNPVTAE